MEFRSLRVRNFRSIGAEQTLDMTSSALTVVGPNNSGKTNMLRALRMFFTGWENREGYDRAADLTFGKTREQTTMVASFTLGDTPRELALLDTYDRLLALYEPPRQREGSEIQLQLIFSLKGSPTYRLSSESTSKVPRENQGSHSRLLHQLVEDLIAAFSVHYVPSSSSSEQLFEELVLPLLKSNVADTIRAEIAAMESALESVSRDLTSMLKDSGLETLGVRFGLPGPNRGAFLSFFDFDLLDPNSTSVFEKGRGIQALAMFACFAWISQHETSDGLSSLWLIEEPESYLNPELYDNALRLLDRIGQHSQVIRTTHALGMVPSEPSKIVGSSLGPDLRTRFSTFESAQAATAALRASLGVRFSDFFALTEHNVFTEGASDVRLIVWALDRLGGADVYPTLAQASFRPFGGVSDLKAFLQANYAFIRPERSVLSIFDGDQAGLRAVRELTQYLGNKGSGFESNVDYVLVRTDHPIEGLFPDAYLIEMRRENEAWFDAWVEDAAGDVSSFHIRDQSKRAADDWLMGRADRAPDIAEWSARWLPVLAAADAALAGWRPGRS